jgi:hypothetical protein
MVAEAPECSGRAEADGVTEAMRVRMKLLRADEALIRVPKKRGEEAEDEKRKQKLEN